MTVAGIRHLIDEIIAVRENGRGILRATVKLMRNLELIGQDADALGDTPSLCPLSFATPITTLLE